MKPTVEVEKSNKKATVERLAAYAKKTKKKDTKENDK